LRNEKPRTSTTLLRLQLEAHFVDLALGLEARPGLELEVGVGAGAGDV
jgi:hypothetical protein